MTILEALNVDVNNSKLSEKNLIKVGLDSSLTYEISFDATIELAKAYCFKSIATQPDWNEDGQGANYSRSYLIKEANRIFELNDLDSEIIFGKNTVSDITNLW